MLSRAPAGSALRDSDHVSAGGIWRADASLVLLLSRVGMFQVVWFKRDLRIADHAPLARAAMHGPVLPLYVAEPDYWALPDTSGRQWAFIAEALEDLRRDLARLGQPLVVRAGDIVDLLGRLHARHGVARLWSHEETGNLWTYERDKAVGALCRRLGVPWTEIPQFGVVRGLEDRDGWSRAFETFMGEPLATPPATLPPIAAVDPGVIPTAAELGAAPDPCPGRQRGGRTEALALLDSFFAGRGRAYPFEMSSPLTAATSCSRLSAHLAVGSISIRETLRRALAERARRRDPTGSDGSIPTRSIDSFVSRLHWHCHFIQKLESEPELELRAAHPMFRAARVATPDDDPLLVAWIEGKTGFPFVDACMRSLRATGWINFRMRAMLMAFASYHLALDWRVSGARLARLFTDYEPGIHWPQVQMQSGQTGINTPRIYNPVKQSVDQDRDGVFIARWVPELARLPASFIHEPWRMSLADQEAHGVVLGLHYPRRIVDHEEAARAARRRLSEIRGQAGFGGAARAVYVKHGSRARPLNDDNPSAMRAAKSRRAKAKAKQLAFDI